MSDNTASAGPVLVCITPQRSCAQLIKSGEMIALKNKTHLKVLAVFAKKNGADKENSAILEELYEAARMSDATMSVYFNDSPDILAAVFSAKENVSSIVTGFPRENSSGFVQRLHDLVPAVPIIMIDDDGAEHRILPEKVNTAK